MIDTPSFWGNATIALAILVALVSYVLLSFTAFFESEFFSLNSSEMAEIKISNEKNSTVSKPYQKILFKH